MHCRILRVILLAAVASLRSIGAMICLTHWGRVTHICVSKQSIIGSDNGLAPGRRQAIIWTNTGILFNGTLWTNFSEIRNLYIFIQENAFQNVVRNMAAILFRPQCVNPMSVCQWSSPERCGQNRPESSQKSVNKYRLKRKEKNKSREEIFYQMKGFFC